MYLREFLNKTIKTTINGMISEGKPIPMDTPNDFVYPDFKKYAYKNRKMFKKELQKSNGDSSKMSLTLSALWYKWARKNHPNFTHIKDSKKFGRALMVMMVKDDLIFSIDAFKKTNNIAKLKEDSELDQAFLKAKPVEEETKRDYKKEYAKYGKSKKAKKYRAELNKYNRDKGTYGNGDGKDASHKGGKIVGFEAQSKNRGRREKSRLKKEATFVPNSGTMSGGVLRLDNRKYQLKKDIKNVSIGSYIVTLPKGTILYNIAGGLFADHKSLEQYADRNQKYFKKPTFKGISIRQKPDTIKDVEKNSKVLESVNEGMFSAIDLIRQNSKDASDFIKNVFKDKDFKDMKNDKEFLKYLKSIFEGFSSDAQRKAAFANGYEEKGKKKESIEEYDVENEQDIQEFVEFMKEYKSDINEGEYQGRDVKLGKIMQGDVKKFKVYVKNPKGNVVKVNFGHKGKGNEKTMSIKKNNPERRKAFRARHNCDNPGPRHKARYWSCKKW